MAKAEVTGVGNYIRVTTCGHFACSCKTELSDEPMDAYVDVNTVVENDSIYTELAITDDNNQKRRVLVPGSNSPAVMAGRYNQCEDPEITAAGVICGAVKGRK
jgi:hypothetical protein